MKKFAWILVAMLIASTAFSAEVLSKNAVGFVKIDVTGGEYQALTVPFTDGSENVKIAWTNTSLAKGAKDGDMVYFWDNDTGWTGYLYSEKRGWNKNVLNKTLDPGQMIFYRPEVDGTITISGEVPADLEFPVGVLPGGCYSAVGNPYPVEVAWTNTELALAAKDGDMVYFWDNETGWTGYLYSEKRGWNKNVQNKVLKPGQGVFYRAESGDAKSVQFNRPYKWPAEEDKAGE